MGRNGSVPSADDIAAVDVSELRILSIEDVLGAQDIKEETVAVPEWGGAVRIKGFTKAEQHLIREQAGGADNLDLNLFEMLLFVHGVIEPQFTQDHIELLKAKNAVPFDRVLQRVMAISGLTEEARKQAKNTFPSST